MTGEQLQALRDALGMDRVEFADLLGYTGTLRNNERRISRLEHSEEPVPLYIARLAWLIAMYVERTGAPPIWPEWPGYDYDHSPDPEPEGDRDAGSPRFRQCS
jgi:transcriptional regulator with XRE-family HTH domain